MAKAKEKTELEELEDMYRKQMDAEDDTDEDQDDDDRTGHGQTRRRKTTMICPVMMKRKKTTAPKSKSRHVAPGGNLKQNTRQGSVVDAEEFSNALKRQPGDAVVKIQNLQRTLEKIRRRTSRH